MIVWWGRVHVEATCILLNVRVSEEVIEGQTLAGIFDEEGSNDIKESW